MRNTSDNHFNFSLILVIFFITMGFAAPSPGQNSEILKKMKHYEGKYHHLYYDLSDEEAREVLIRMEAMVEEYIQRTKDFTGRPTAKLPFLIFRNKEDYYRAGGMEGTAGVFNGSQLLAIAGEKLTLGTWHTIQHEGFHQFVHYSIGGNIPVWLNEGLAEYFGEAVFTGDNYVSGTIPFHRLQLIRQQINSNAFKTLDGMMSVSHREWNAEMSGANYDQAWSMVMFLAHGDGGKYQKPFGQYILMMGRGTPETDAWRKCFGSTTGFETVWKEWWLSKDRDNDIEPFATASVQMFASYMARASISKIKLEQFDELVAAIRDDKIRQIKTDLIPDGLSKDCLSLYDALKNKRKCIFSLKMMPVGQSRTLTQQEIVCELPDGTIISGSFKLKNGTRVDSVQSRLIRPQTTPTSKPSK